MNSFVIVNRTTNIFRMFTPKNHTEFNQFIFQYMSRHPDDDLHLYGPNGEYKAEIKSPETNP